MNVVMRTRFTDTYLVVYAAEELNRQLAANRTCALCGKAAVSGVHTTCDHCGRPVCGVCAVQLDGCVFCPTCPHELPF
jgi:hypothetical protein